MSVMFTHASLHAYAKQSQLKIHLFPELCVILHQQMEFAHVRELCLSSNVIFSNTGLRKSKSK